MHAAAASTSLLEARLVELLMSTLCPCDLGDGVEVIHDVEDAVEIEMECDVDDNDAPSETELAGDTLPFSLPDDLVNTMQFRRDDLDTTTEIAREDVGTHEFVRYSAPYERIELQIDPHAFVRATIEEARSASA